MSLTTLSTEKVGAQSKPILVDPSWELIPSGLGPLDEFRLIFVTAEKRKTNDNTAEITVFNKFVQQQAGNGLTALRAYKDNFRVVGSTLNTNVKDNTNTSGNHQIPIYWVKGEKVATGYNDFYDGSWQSKNPTDQNGIILSGTVEVATGSNNNGTTATRGNQFLGEPAGNGGLYVRYGIPGKGGNAKPLDAGTKNRRDELRYYGLSPVFKIKGKIELLPINVSKQEGEQLDFRIKAVPTPSSTNPIKIEYILTDDKTANFLAKEYEAQRSYTITSNQGNLDTIQTRVDPYTDVDGKISLEITKYPYGYEVPNGKSLKDEVVITSACPKSI